jgi:hypothetical protein
LPIDGFAFIVPMSTPKSKIRGANKRGHSSLIEPPGVAGIRLTPKFNYIVIFLFVNKILKNLIS